MKISSLKTCEIIKSECPPEIWHFLLFRCGFSKKDRETVQVIRVMEGTKILIADPELLEASKVVFSLFQYPAETHPSKEWEALERLRLAIRKSQVSQQLNT